MPYITYDQTLSGAGSAQMGGTRVYYVAWEVTIIGNQIRQANAWDPYSQLGVGYFQLGNDLTPAGSISGVGYDSPVWLNWLLGQWIVEPAEVASNFTSAIAQYIRWAFTPGTSVHLYVLGDA